MFNAGKALIKGIEFGLNYDVLYKKERTIKIKIPVSITFTYTNASFNETFVNGGGDWGSGVISKGDFIPFVTPILLTTTIGLENTKFYAALTARYTGETRIKPGKNSKISPQSGTELAIINTLESFLIIDFSANYFINKHFTVFTSINNLSNSKAIIANLPQGYRPNIPLSVHMGIKVSF